MKLRLAPEHIRFRISKDEYERLKNTEEISEATHLSGGFRIRYQIASHSDGVSANGNALELVHITTSAETTLILTVYHSAVEMLALPIHAKEGVKAFLTFDDGEMLTVAIEIDLSRHVENA